MDIPRNDMLPDESQTISDISEDVKTQEPRVEEKKDERKPEATPEKKEVKTPSNELLAALKEERRMRKDAEHKLQELESSSAVSEFLDDDSLSIEGRMLKKQIESMTSKLRNLEQERESDKVFTQFPQLKDKEDEFKEFSDDYPGVPREKVAKLFLSEYGMLDSVSRKGLEQATGGDKKEESTGISAQDVTRLMQNQPREFIKMVRSGKLRAEDVQT